eukprot:Awhi_evm1s4312
MKLSLIASAIVGASAFKSISLNKKEHREYQLRNLAREHQDVLDGIVSEGISPYLLRHSEFAKHHGFEVP